MPNSPIEDYGVIGDLHTVALVSMDASIDFLCLPDFDSPTIFAALLDEKNGGNFSIVPVLKDARRKQMYLPETNILTTRYQSENAIAEIVDYMPVNAAGDWRRIIRTVRVIKGDLKFELVCRPRFDYGRQKHKARKLDATVIEFQAVNKPPKRSVTKVSAKAAAKLGKLPQRGVCPPVRLIGGAALRIEAEDGFSSFSLKQGEETSFIFECGACDDLKAAVSKEAIGSAFAETTNYWKAWSAKSNYKGRWREIVTRSALLLKLLTSRTHGSIIAAPTFGLPERVGSSRNWDYRYTWMRDSAFTLYAFMRLGYTDEARSFMMWLRDRIDLKSKNGPLQVMYRADGGKDLEEISLEHLAGYRKSLPVRIGNAASKQLQLDIYGELIDAIYLAIKYGNAPTYDGWKRLSGLVAYVAKNWKRPDEGIWEVRGGRRKFLHSRVMCWVAVDRALRLADKRSLPAPMQKWQQLRTDIYESVFKNFWNEKLQSFVAYEGADFVDASALLMPLLRFISPIDPRWRSTMKKIEADLTEDALVYRYNAKATGVDGLEGREGTFTACSFWYIECLARSGQSDKARLMFERMISYANHLGLYSEQLGPSGEHVGNFPQALTHLALISAASYLDRALSGNEHGEWR
jgi:GH15 family glucan-1,4-alpha-glucosidase